MSRAARLRGFEEDLRLEGNQFASVLSALYIGYIIMQIPSLVLSHICLSVDSDGDVAICSSITAGSHRYTYLLVWLSGVASQCLQVRVILLFYLHWLYWLWIGFTTKSVTYLQVSIEYKLTPIHTPSVFLVPSGPAFSSDL